jgi:hypothetical protein
MVCYSTVTKALREGGNTTGARVLDAVHGEVTAKSSRAVAERDLGTGKRQATMARSKPGKSRPWRSKGPGRARLGEGALGNSTAAGQRELGGGGGRRDKASLKPNPGQGEARDMGRDPS